MVNLNNFTEAQKALFVCQPLKDFSHLKSCSSKYKANVKPVECGNKLNTKA